MDYEALAKQYGGTVETAPVQDYEALAKQFGGVLSTPPLRSNVGPETTTPAGTFVPQEKPWGETLKQAGQNFVPGMIQLGKDIGHMVTSPVETVEGLKTIVGGAVLKALPKDLTDFLFNSGVDPTAAKRAMEVAANAGGQIAENYGSVEGFKRKLASDPVGALSDISILATGGGGLVRGGSKLAGMAGLEQTAGALGKTANVLGTAGNVLDPVTGTLKAAETVGKVAMFPLKAAYNVVAPMTNAGAESVKMRGYLKALNDDPVLAQQAADMLRQGMTIEQVATTLNSSGLAAFARTSQDASTVTRDLYNNRANQLAGAQSQNIEYARQHLNALAEASLPESKVPLSQPRQDLLSRMRDEAAAVEAQKAQRTRQLTAPQLAQERLLEQQRLAAEGNVANVSQLETGEKLASAQKDILKKTREEVVSPAYKAAFDAAPDATINVSNVGIASKAQLDDLLTKIEGLAPNAAELLRQFGPKTKEVMMGEGVTAKVAAEPKLINLEDAHKIREAINIDRAALKSSNESGANIARSRLNELYTAVNEAIAKGVPEEALTKFNEANTLFKNEIVGVHRTGQPSNLTRTSTLNEPMLRPENIVSTAMKDEGTTRQFLKVYSQDAQAMDTLKTGIEDLYRREVLSPTAGAKAHDSFMAKNAEQLKALDEAGMGMRDRLSTVNNELSSVAAKDAELAAKRAGIPDKVAADFVKQDEALKLASDTLKFKTAQDLRAAVIKDPMTAGMALERLDAPAKSALARGVMKDALDAGPANMLKHLDDNTDAIMRVLKADNPKTAATVFAEARSQAQLAKEIDALGNKLRPEGKGPAVNSMLTSKNVNELTQGLPEVRAVVDDIQRELKAGADFEQLAEQGKAAKTSASKLLTQELGAQPTGFFGHAWSIANIITNRLKGKIDAKLAAQIGAELANSETAASAIEKAISRQSRADTAAKFITLPYEYGISKPVRSRAVTGVLQAEDAYNRNNLRP